MNRSLRSIMILGFAGVLSMSAQFTARAVPPSPISVFQEEKVKDMVGNWDGMAGKSSSTSRSFKVIGATVPLHGDVRLLAIRVAFQQDTNANTSGNGTFPYRTWGPASEPGYLSSRLTDLSNYYKEVSGNRINLIPKLEDVTLSKPMSAYSGTNSLEMMRDVVQFADGWINFSNYDIVMLIHAGAGQEGSLNTASQDIWSHYMRMPDASFGFPTNDGAIVAGWVVVPETQCNDSVFMAYNSQITDIVAYEKNPTAYANVTIPKFWDVQGVWAHEVGHAFGMPDVYDTSKEQTGLSLEDWSLMANGSWLPVELDDNTTPSVGSVPCHPDAWNKKLLSWTTIVDVTTRRVNEVIPAQSSSTGAVFRLWTDGDTTSREYFLLEYRSKTGYDRFIPESGIMIYHIDDTSGTLTMNNLQVNGNRPRIYPVSADGVLEQVGTSYYPLKDTAFPGSINNTAFGQTTNPNSLSYTGNVTSVDVRNIRLDGSIAYADLSATSGTTITFVNPLPGETIHVTDPTIRVTAPDLVPESIQISVNGNAVPYTNYNAKSGELSLQLHSLAIGEYKVEVTAVDASLYKEINGTLTFNVANRLIRSGLRMISIPATNCGSAQDVFQGISPLKLAWYNPVLGQYHTFPDPAVEFQNPSSTVNQRDLPAVYNPPAGKGFWIELPVNTSIRLSGDYLRNDKQYAIALKSGFNMIGNPYSSPVSFGSLLVEYRGKTYFIDQAVSQGLIDPVIFTWTNRGYALAELPMGVLEPWAGYWVNVRADTSIFPLMLVFQPMPQRVLTRSVSRDSRNNSVLWNVDIHATDVVDLCKSTVMLGVASKATDDIDTVIDLFAPPAPQGEVSISSMVGRQNALLRDYRAPGEQMTYSWDLLVTGKAGTRVKITWPNLTKVPKDYTLLLRDNFTGEECYLRTSPGYTVTFGNTEQKRSLTLTAKSSIVGALQISSVHAQSVRSGSISINCFLSMPAIISAEIRTVSGKLVATIPAVARNQGNASLTWGGKAISGKPIPRGLYQCHIIAATGNGQVAKAVTLIQL